jgi:hypothetical protein
VLGDLSVVYTDSEACDKEVAMNASPWRATFDEQLKNSLQLLPITDEWSPQRPSENTLKITRLLVDEIWRTELPPPSVTVAADGSIHIKWRKGSRQFSVMVMPDQIVEYCFVENGQLVPEDGSLAVDQFNRVNEFLGWLLLG